MSGCCDQPGRDDRPLRTLRCPLSGGEGAEVPVRTIVHHVKLAWAWAPSADRYFFCDDPACEVAYFGADGSTILKSALRTRIGVKERSGDAPLCYCFGVSKGDFDRNPAVRDFVVAQTRAGRCSCATSNPSGRCCLKDFPKPRT
jgi:hypothetical protein